MTAAVKKYPSRIKYEETHPGVTFRMPLEDYERLNKIREEDGLSFSEIIMIGAGMIELDKEEERERIEAVRSSIRKVPIGKCWHCGNPFYWDLTNPVELRSLADIVNRDKQAHHAGCLSREMYARKKAAQIKSARKH